MNLDKQIRALSSYSHDRTLLSKVCKKIFHIQHAKIKEYNGAYADYLSFLAEKEEERKKTLTKLKNTLKRETEWMRQGIKARGTRAKYRVDHYHELKTKVSEVISLAKKNINFNISHSQRKAKKVLEFQNVSFSYTQKPLFNDISTTIYRGDKIGILGANGVGKSTLVSLVASQLTPTKGSIKKADNLKIKYFSQKRSELNLQKTPYEIAGEGNDFITLPNGKRKHVISYLEDFLFPREEIHRPLKTFSGGEKNRLQMALNLKESADLFIFDEPTNDLDIDTLQILETKLAEFNESLLLISHDREVF